MQILVHFLIPMQAKSFKELYKTLKITTKVCDYVTIEE